MSNNDDQTTLDIRGLERVIKALKTRRPPIARVGILGSAAAAPHPTAKGKVGGKTPTIAQVGAWHEFGTSRHPVRSFLRLPLSALLGKILEASGAFARAAMDQLIAEGTLEPWVAKMAKVGEEIVIEAFVSGGFGTWVPSDMRRKRTKITLVETYALVNSISSDVVT